MRLKSLGPAASNSLVRSQFRQRLLFSLIQKSQADSPSLPFQDHLSTARSHLRWLSEGLRQDDSRNLRRRVHQHIVHDKPIAYILGNVPFYPLPRGLITRPPILIPRWETEEWTNKLGDVLEERFRMENNDDKLNVLEIGTGTGCIALSLAYRLRKYQSQFKIVSVDKNPMATQLANENLAVYTDLQNVRFVHGDIFDMNLGEKAVHWLGGKVNLIVSNPPYITKKDYEMLEQSVKGWEDKGALVGSGTDDIDDGLQFYRRIATFSSDKAACKFRDGWPSIVVEVGEKQSEEVYKIFSRETACPTSWKDGAGIERVVLI